MVINHNGKKMKMNIYICIHIKVNHFPVHQKQYKSTTLQLKKTIYLLYILLCLGLFIEKTKDSILVHKAVFYLKKKVITVFHYMVVPRFI